VEAVTNKRIGSTGMKAPPVPNQQTNVSNVNNSRSIENGRVVVVEFTTEHRNVTVNQEGSSGQNQKKSNNNVNAQMSRKNVSVSVKQQQQQ